MAYGECMNIAYKYVTDLICCKFCRHCHNKIDVHFLKEHADQYGPKQP